MVRFPQAARGRGDSLSLTTDSSKANNKDTGPGQHPASGGCACWQERVSAEPGQTAAVHAGTQTTTTNNTNAPLSAPYQHKQM